MDPENKPVTDEQRQLAASKKVTVQPLHGNVTPEDLPDSELVAHHLTRGALPNAENDTEQKQPLIKPSDSALKNKDTPEKKPSYLTLIIAFILGMTGMAFVVYLSIQA